MERMKRLLLLWAAVAAFVSQNLVIPVISAPNFEDQKHYYTPRPSTGTPPTVSQTPPTHGSGGGHATPTPSHGGGSYGGTPPANCGNPPSGGHHRTSPSPRGGGYYRSPPISTPTPTPTTPTTPTPTTPTTPTPTTPTPTTPTTPTPPVVEPGTPTIPSPPFSFGPTSPPFTCIYWRTHPGLIWGLFGWIGTVGGTFGVTSLPGIGANMNLLQALSNTRTDGYGELYREGTAALLNSMAHSRFPYTTTQVRDSFVAALSSNKAAAVQARIFKLANEGRTTTRA